LLGAAIIYGTVRWHYRRKDRAFEARRDAATRAQDARQARQDESAEKSIVERLP
jgi:hypothetical protein